MKNPVQAPAGANPDGRHRRRVVHRQPTLPGRTISSGATRQVCRWNTGRGRKPKSAHREDGEGVMPPALPRVELRRAVAGVRRGRAAPPRQSPLVRTRGRLAMTLNRCHGQLCARAVISPRQPLPCALAGRCAGVTDVARALRFLWSAAVTGRPFPSATRSPLSMGSRLCPPCPAPPGPVRVRARCAPAPCAPRPARWSPLMPAALPALSVPALEPAPRGRPVVWTPPGSKRGAGPGARRI